MRGGKTLAATAVTVLILASACDRSESPAPAVPATTAKAPIGFLSSPAEKQVIAPGTFVSGWALAEAGIANVAVTFDDGQKGYVRRGDNFPGVSAQYPNYPDADKAGYIFAIPKLNPGPHSLTLTVTSRDGGSMQIERHFQIP
jgi:hypothetical protein